MDPSLINLGSRKDHKRIPDVWVTNSARTMSSRAFPSSQLYRGAGRTTIAYGTHATKPKTTPQVVATSTSTKFAEASVHGENASTSLSSAPAPVMITVESTMNKTDSSRTHDLELSPGSSESSVSSPDKTAIIPHPPALPAPVVEVYWSWRNQQYLTRIQSTVLPPLPPPSNQTMNSSSPRGSSLTVHEFVNSIASTCLHRSTDELAIYERTEGTYFRDWNCEKERRAHSISHIAGELFIWERTPHNGHATNDSIFNWFSFESLCTFFFGR
jgi:hypothetical protein